MPRDFGDRLDRVEILIAPAGCPTCRRWNGHVLGYVDPVTNEVTLDRDECCPWCGRLVPILHEIHLVGLEPGDL